jgi:hypothetical protein
VEHSQGLADLITGVLAVIAAVIAYRGSRQQANAALEATRLALSDQAKRQTDEEERQRTAFAYAMAAEMRTLKSAVKVAYIHLERVGLVDRVSFDVLPVPSLLSAPWQDLMFLTQEEQQSAASLRYYLERSNNVAKQYQGYKPVGVEQEFWEVLSQVDGICQKLLNSLITRAPLLQGKEKNAG